MVKERILIVDDEEDVLELVQYNLDRNGYHVETVSSGEEALTRIKRKQPNLVVLDLMLPGINGLEVCNQLKSDIKTKGIPIIMLTAKGEEADIVTGLELGADDYVTKPFSLKVLVARIRRFLRRTISRDLARPPLQIQDLTIDSNRHEVLIKGKSVHPTLTEFNILYALH